MTQSLSAAAVQSGLQAYFESTEHHLSRRVHNVVAISSGWENEIFSFELVSSNVDLREREPLILRMYTGARASEKAEHEFNSMRSLYDVGYPVPHVERLEQATAWLGFPFVIIECIAGGDLWSTLSKCNAERKQSLRTRFCQLFTQLHALNPRSVVPSWDATTQPHAYVDGFLLEARTQLQQYGLLDLLPYVDWLQNRRDLVPCVRPSVIHGDFHYNNILLHDDDEMTVIDWSSLRISDARFDLGWMLMLQRTHIGVEERNLLLAEYLRLSPVPMTQIEWFETHAALRRVWPAVALLVLGAEKFGAHPNAIDSVQRFAGPIALAYELLVSSTSIRAASIEQTLSR